MYTIYKSWIRPAIEYGSILYSGAASTHLHRLDNLQSCIEGSCSFVFSTTLSQSKCCNYGIGMPSVSWRGLWELTDLLPTVLWQSDSLSVSSSLLLGHLSFVNPCNFRTLDRFKLSWLATAADIWNGLPADLILQGEACGWRTILKDVQCCICT